MAQQYSLEQQEQLASIKSFWEKWGTPIAIVVLIAALAAAGWVGWNHWKNSQAEEATILLEQMNLAIEQNNEQCALQKFSVLRADYDKTAQTGQGGLVRGKYLADRKKRPEAKETL